MIKKLSVLAVTPMIIYGCDGNASSLISPMDGQSINQSLLQTNDEAVKKLGLKSGSDNPPPLSFSWLSERLRELRNENADPEPINEYGAEERNER